MILFITTQNELNLLLIATKRNLCKTEPFCIFVVLTLSVKNNCLSIFRVDMLKYNKETKQSIMHTDQGTK